MSEILSKKFKVLFILHLPPPVHGAAIANSYIHNSVGINEEFETEYISLATNRKLEQTGKASLKKLFTMIFLMGRIIKALVLNKYDLCYMSLTASGPAFYKDLIIVALLKLFNKKILYHFHNKGVAMAEQSLLNRVLYRFAFRNTFSILLSRYLYQDIAAYVKENDVYYCPYGIPASGLAGTHRRVDATSSRCNLLYLSNMMVQKGVFVLLEACKELKRRNCDFICHFVGGWTDITKEEFDSYIAEHDLHGFVIAHGPKYKEEKLAFFNDSDIFIFPTFYHYETFGLVNLEAMQHSIPVIATPEGGIPDVVVDGETGFLVKQKEVAALTEKVEQLIKDPELRIRMGKAGERRYRDLFTIEKFETNIARIISQVIARP